VALVDWDRAMAAPRCAGGHTDVMHALFRNAEVIAHFDGDDYQGTVAFAYRFGDGSVVLVTSYYGSCCGCDSWEDASDADARKLIHDLAANAHWFPSLTTAILLVEQFAGTAEYYAEDELRRLLPGLKAQESPRV